MAQACFAAALPQMRADIQSPWVARSKSAAIKVRASSGGCCGGSGGSGGNSCSSKKNDLTLPNLDYDLASSSSSCCSSSSSSASASAPASKSHGLDNVGKEFEALVAQQTLIDLEKDYETTQMRGTISRELVKEANMSAVSSEGSNSCIDVDELLAKADDCNFIFADGQEDIVLV